MSKDDAPIFNFNESTHRTAVKLMVDGLKGRGFYRVHFARLRDQEQKTLSQLGYLFGVVYPDIAPMLSEATGKRYDTMRTHAFLKDKFLKRPVVNVHTGEELGEETPSLADLTVQECSEYIEECILFAAENGWTVRPAAQFQEQEV